MARTVRYRAIALLAALLVARAPAAAGGLAGPAFSDPDGVIEMPAAWRQRGIEYQAWARGADLAVSLDQHLYPALLPIVRRFAEESGLRIAVQEGTCGISAGKLEEKTVDMGGFCCPAGRTDRLPGLEFHTLGVASLALFVHARNPVDTVSLKEARGIFRGEVYRWAEVAPATGEGLIQPIGRLHCKARPGHWRLILDNEDLFSPRLYEVPTIPDMLRAVANDPRAIGYEVIWNVAESRLRSRLKFLEVNGVEPRDRQALAAGEYPLYRVYNVATWGPEQVQNEHAGALLAYLYEHFEEVEPRYGIVPAERLREQGWRFRGDELIGGPMR
ncbi:MAG TPA: hypothetical protein VKA64_01180 [Gammaproteobacteria bacterium]|nr:hypothetical protein [Gammaproteobacteria bacterium]